MKETPPSKSRVIVKRLWKDYIRKYFKLIVITAILLVISSLATSAQPLLIQQAFDKVFKAHDTHALVTVPLMIIGVFVVQALTSYWSSMLMGRFTNGMIADMRKALFTHIIDNEIEFYNKNDSGSLLSRLVSEIIHVTAAISNFFNAWCRQLVTAMGLFAVMLYQSVELTFLSLIAFGLAAYPLLRITTRLKKLTRQLNENNSNLISRLMESLSGIRTVKSFRKEEFEIQKIAGYVDEIEKSSNRTNMISIITVPMLQILSGMAMFSRPVRSLSNSGGTMVKGYIGAERYFEIIDSKPNFINREHGTHLAVSLGQVTFQDVGFSYPTGMQALGGISFIAEAGKKTALVGHSGSGKSTIFNLIMKFYAPASGHILVDGQDLSKASINSARANMALVSQDIFIFDETAMNNIGYGREGATEAEIKEAAIAAHCHEFIMQLPKGYDTKLGFAGETLSGGQKQRIAIARAFLRNAPILLLDEATSALDPKTENDLQESLDRLSKNRTTIIIAHRLSTVINADKMILLENGQVAASGTHESLMRESPVYRSHFGL